MKTLRCLIPILAVYSITGACAASEFEVTIRANSERVKYGDPLYVEVTLVNRGKDPVIAPPVSMDAGTFALKVSDPNTGLSMSLRQTGGAFGFQDVTYEPNQPVKHYWHVFLPGIPRFDHVFWKPLRSKGQAVQIAGAYCPRKRVLVSSNTIKVLIEPRDEAEMKMIGHWASSELDGDAKGPLLQDLGLSFRSALSRSQAEQLASKVQEGEFHDLLLLSMQMMDIYATPADDRDAKNHGLVQWLKKQPDVKRQVLIKETRTIAETYNLNSTGQALKALSGPP